MKYGKNKPSLKLTKPDQNRFVIYSKSNWNFKSSLNQQIQEQSRLKLVELIYKLRTTYTEKTPICVMHNKDKKFRKIVKELVIKMALK